MLFFFVHPFFPELPVLFCRFLAFLHAAPASGSASIA